MVCVAAISSVAAVHRRAPAHGDDHHHEEQCAGKQGAARAYPGCQRACERGTDGTGEIERYGAQPERTRQVGARHQVVDVRLLRRQVEREAGADQKGAREQGRGSEHAEQCRDAERRGGRKQAELRRQNDSAPVDDVRERAGEQSEKK